MYTAKRTALNKFSLYKAGGEQIASMSFTGRLAVWPAEGAPLNGAVVGSGLGAYPEFILNGIAYKAQRALLSNQFIFNSYDIWLGKDGRKAIEIRTSPPSWTWPISYQGKTYLLKRKHLFAFKYELSSEDGRRIASFTDSTPFLQFSERRDFAIDTTGPVDEMLLAFSFWIAVIAFF